MPELDPENSWSTYAEGLTGSILGPDDEKVLLLFENKGTNSYKSDRDEIYKELRSLRMEIEFQDLHGNRFTKATEFKPFGSNEKKTKGK